MAEHDNDAGVVVYDDGDPRAPAGRQGPGGEAEGPLAVIVVRVDLQLRHVNGAGAMRSAALLAMSLAAAALVGGGTGVSRPNQFRALMVWLGGCIGVFLRILSLMR